ncbi:MAG: regulator of chromosome condensation, partial [Armatimonadetes bacterium]|nr:regulator of chromosome condensation [Armatimonadota bacterium]
PEERPLHWVSVAGTVLDQDQQGLAGVRISVPGHPYSAVSDARGFYCLLNMPAGEYAIRAAEDRCAPVTKTVRVLGESAPHYVPENFELVEAALTGVVRRVPNAQPVPNVLVRAGAEETTTDLEGGFAFLHLPVGPVELAIAVPGFLPQRRTIQIEPEPQAGKQRDRDPAEIAPPRIPRVEFLLFPAALSGRVSDRHTGAPIANAQVELMDGTRLVTGPRGEFGLEHLPEGPHRIVVSAPSYRTYEHLFTLRSNRGVAGSAVLPIALQAEVPHQDRPEPEAPQETAGTARGGKRRRVGE